MATDKEYLTFCNASNLDWQYASIVKLRDKKTDTYRFPHLSELLDPKKFKRVYKNENGVITGTKQIYSSPDDMKKIAGVTMNYLEECGKNSKEGDFLKEWEAGKAINN